MFRLTEILNQNSMKGTYIGEFEELVLLVVGTLYDDAYGLAIVDESGIGRVSRQMNQRRCAQGAEHEDGQQDRRDPVEPDA